MRGPASTQSFFRLFVAPGMQHCQGGVAPNSFGQAWVAPGVSGDPQHDIRSALQTWVEAGRPPQSLRAAMLARDNRIVIATQELRPYPRPAGPIVMSR
jgi:feruloyl esterase